MPKESVELTELGKYIHQACQQQWPEQGIPERLGISESYFWKLQFKEDVHPSPDVALRIQDKIGLEPDGFLTLMKLSGVDLPDVIIRKCGASPNDAKRVMDFALQRQSEPLGREGVLEHSERGVLEAARRVLQQVQKILFPSAPSYERIQRTLRICWPCPKDSVEADWWIQVLRDWLRLGVTVHWIMTPRSGQSLPDQVGTCLRFAGYGRMRVLLSDLEESPAPMVVLSDNDARFAAVLVEAAGYARAISLPEGEVDGIKYIFDQAFDRSTKTRVELYSCSLTGEINFTSSLSQAEQKAHSHIFMKSGLSWAYHPERVIYPWVSSLYPPPAHEANREQRLERVNRLVAERRSRRAHRNSSEGRPRVPELLFMSKDALKECQERFDKLMKSRNAADELPIDLSGVASEAAAELKKKLSRPDFRMALLSTPEDSHEKMFAEAELQVEVLDDVVFLEIMQLGKKGQRSFYFAEIRSEAMAASFAGYLFRYWLKLPQANRDQDKIKERIERFMQKGAKEQASEGAASPPEARDTEIPINPS